MPLAPSSVPGPFSGLTVLDLTHALAGPYCTMMLADLGARVVKVETPGCGDDSRHIGPFVDNRSIYFMSINRGKESIALDLRDAGDRAIFDRLLAKADVVVENFRPGVMERLGLAWEQLQPRFPRLVYAAASGFGQTGPYRQRPAYDMVVQAMGGMMSVTGHKGGPPARVGMSIGDISAGLFLMVGISAALRHRERTGIGMRVDVAMLDCQVALLENAVARYCATGEVAGPLGTRHPLITPFQAYKTRDSWIVIAVANDRLFERLATVLERPDLASNPRFCSVRERTDHHEALQAELERALAAHATAEWLQVLEASGIPCGEIANIAQVVADPQVRSRNMICSLDDPQIGKVAVVGSPVKLSAFPDPPTRPHAPALDEHRAILLAELDAAAAD